MHPRAVGAHPHDGALAQLLLDLGDGEVQGLAAFGIELVLFGSHLWCSACVKMDVLSHNNAYDNLQPKMIRSNSELWCISSHFVHFQLSVHRSRSNRQASSRCSTANPPPRLVPPRPHRSDSCPPELRGGAARPPPPDPGRGASASRSPPVRSEALTPPGLHLDEGHQGPAADHQVEIVPAHPEPMRQHHPPGGMEEGDRFLLAIQAEPVTRVGPRVNGGYEMRTRHRARRIRARLQREWRVQMRALTERRDTQEPAAAPSARSPGPGLALHAPRRGSSSDPPRSPRARPAGGCPAGPHRSRCSRSCTR